MTSAVETSGRERRRNARKKLSLAAKIETPPRAPRDCVLVDLSVGGALVCFDHALGLFQKVILHIDGLAPVPGQVARVSSTVAAITFEDADSVALAAFIASCTAA